jgi:putative ABC transport system permease protein
VVGPPAPPAARARGLAGGAWRLLARKAWRDVRHQRGQMVAIITVIALGVATWVSLRGMAEHLTASQEGYYASARFAHAFARVVAAPLEVAEQARRIPGVSAAEGRIVADVVARVPGLAEPATVRLVSVPAGGQPRLNALVLRAGRWPDPARRTEVLASEAFTQANRLQPGDAIEAILNGRAETLHLVGIALSPEFIYEIPATGAVLPDSRRFGVLWAPAGLLADAFDLRGSFNDLVLAYAPGAEARAILPALDRLLAPYGSLGAYGREDQVSHRFVSDEIEQNRKSALVVPVVFLAVAAYLLALTLGRVVAMQREQIGALKAFGYTDGELLGHVLMLALLPALGGVAVGSVLGVWLARVFAGVYADFYRIPLAVYRPTAATLATGALVALLAALLGALRAARRAARLPPAEAMRAEPPPRFTRGAIERLPRVRRAPTATRMVVRGLERRPVRTLGAVLGLALAVSVGTVGRWSFDAVQVLADRQFRRAQREDVQVRFREPVPVTALATLAHLPDVSLVEPVRETPVRLHAGARRERTALVALADDAALRRVLDDDGRAVRLPPAGVLLSRLLAERLGVRPGDSLRVERLDGLGDLPPLVVSGTVNELLGTGAYTTLPAAWRTLGEEPVATSALLRTHTGDLRALYADLERVPVVSGVTVRAATLAAFEGTIAASIGITNTVFVLFATAIAAGIVYNGARLSLSERGRELASLRVLGFTAREAGRILLGEQLALTLVALPVGAGLGLLLTFGLSKAISTDTFRLPMIVSWPSVAWSVGVVAVVSLAAAWLVQRRVQRLDLVGVLKTRE